MFEVFFKHYPKIKNHNFYKDKILSIIDNDLDETDLLTTNYCSKTDYFKGNKQFSYHKIVLEALNDYLNDFTQRPLSLSRMWYQQSLMGDYHPAHNHGAIGLSCVWYLEFNPKVHEGTSFIAPFSDALTGHLIRNIVDVKEGEFIVFPSYLLHQQMPNQTKERRTIISMNLQP